MHFATLNKKQAAHVRCVNHALNSKLERLGTQAANITSGMLEIYIGNHKGTTIISPSTMSTKRLPASSLPLSGQFGLWLEGTYGSLYASWSSASISLSFTGSKLCLSIGANTERKDKANGGTPMIAIITGVTEDEALQKPETWRTFDPNPSSVIDIIDSRERQEKTFVRIVLVDWASTFELDAFIIDDAASIEPTSVEGGRKLEMLVIGDSITSTLAVPVEEGGEPVPFGILNGFPFVAQRVLREAPYNLKVDLELVAYPGYNLVHPTENESEGGCRNGMQEAFFWNSPWSKERLNGPSQHFPRAVLIELGKKFLGINSRGVRQAALAGTNDQSFGFSKERFGAAFIDLIKSLKSWYKNSIQHVWLVPPFPDSLMDGKELILTEAMSNYIPLLAAEFGDEISFKICNLVEGLTTANTVDGVHPPLAVHEGLGKRLAAFINSNL